MRGQLRIIGGEWGGRRLPVVSAPGLRPTADRHRETLFNWLQGECRGASALDLFAGTGALGLEALSRGAASVVFVERSRSVAAALKTTLATLGAEARGRVVIGDGVGFCRSAVHPFDLVFLDPPFAKGLLEPALAALIEADLLARSAKVYLEASIDQPLAVLPQGWCIRREKKAGGVWFALLERDG